MSKPTLSMSPDQFIGNGFGLTEARREATLLLSGRPTTEQLQVIQELMARVNGKGVTFQNFIALPETILLCSAIYNDHHAVLTFSLNLTRGRCEDGVIRHVGWNRFYRADACHYGYIKRSRPMWSVTDDCGRITATATTTQGCNSDRQYTFAEDAGGFQQLWSKK